MGAVRRWPEYLPYVFIVALVWVLVGCSPVQCVKPIYDIDRPVLPEVSRERLQCLDDQTYLDLAERDLLLRSYCEMLEAVVEETTE